LLIKFDLRELENEMPIIFVDGQLIDRGHEFDAILAKAASSYQQSTAKSSSNARHFFLLFSLEDSYYRNGPQTAELK